MLRRKKEQTPSKNFCVICGRHTNDKKFPKDNWTNQFFLCRNCKKVWCGACMGQIAGLGPSKAFKLGRKGKVNCPDCDNFAIMVKLPERLPFSQTTTREIASVSSEESLSKNFCKFCGGGIPENSIYCNVCGANQEK